MTEPIKIDPRRLLGVRITVDPTSSPDTTRRGAAATAKTGAKVGAKPSPKII